MGVDSILKAFGAAAPFGVLLCLFAETGILVGIVLPGDSLLFTAGLLASSHHSVKSGLPHINLAVLLVCAAVGALVGAQVGYLLGRRYGGKLFDRPNSRFFKRQHVDRAEEVFNRYGPPKAIVIARFIPVVRTLMNPLAGVLEMNARTFLVWQVLGGLIWSVGVSLAGYFAGNSVPNVDHYIYPIIAAIVVISLIPVALEVRRSRRRPRVTTPSDPA
jgi:membrane-associated protein